MKTDLTQEQVRAIFDYDGENGWLIRKKDKYERIVNRPCGHKPNGKGYGHVGIGGKWYCTHRIIWLWHHGYLSKFIDHIDRNPMNNKIENLRPITLSENQHNQTKRINNSSGYFGVSFHKQTGRFVAYIGVDNKNTNLGYFPTPEEAFLEYMLAKIKYHPTSPIAQQYLRELTYAA